MTRHVLLADDGYGCHLESGLKYTALCGRTFDPEVVDREEYVLGGPDSPHAYLCFDCTTVRAGGTISPRRRELHFGGETA